MRRMRSRSGRRTPRRSRRAPQRRRKAPVLRRQVAAPAGAPTQVLTADATDQLKPSRGFESLVNFIAQNAAMVLGAYPDPRTGQPILDLEGARRIDRHARRVAGRDAREPGGRRRSAAARCAWQPETFLHGNDQSRREGHEGKSTAPHLSELRSSSAMPANQLELTVLGSGTSMGVPTLGCHCAVCSSTDPHDKRTRPSILLSRTDNGIDHGVIYKDNVVIDTTPDFRFQALRAGIDRLDAVVFTHAHADHILGFDDIRPYNSGKRWPCRCTLRRDDRNAAAHVCVRVRAGPGGNLDSRSDAASDSRAV